MNGYDLRDREESEDEVGWAPKYTLLKQELSEMIVTSEFICPGTPKRYNDPENYHALIQMDVESQITHTIFGTTANPIAVVKLRSFTECCTPFSCDSSWGNVFMMCKTCHEMEKRNVKRADQLASMYARKCDEEYKQQRNESAKRHRQEKQVQAARRMKIVTEEAQAVIEEEKSGFSPVGSISSFPASFTEDVLAIAAAKGTTAMTTKETPAESSPTTKVEDVVAIVVKGDKAISAPIESFPAIPASSNSLAHVKELGDWIAKAKKVLRIPDLKEICTANNLMVSGSKDELLFRIMKCKYHGAPGKCPKCQYSKLQFEYDEESMCGLPKNVVCKHMKGMGRSCGYVLASTDPRFAARHTHALVDAAGLLDRQQLSVGSITLTVPAPVIAPAPG